MTTRSDPDRSRSPVFRCLDCSYSGNAFPGGACPGCGSRNVRRIGRRAAAGRPPARRSYRMTLAWVLWAWLVYEALKLGGYL